MGEVLCGGRVRSVESVGQLSSAGAAVLARDCPSNQEGVRCGRVGCVG